ncbi:MAG TPA: glucans biosynthesis glucosyltransferase MdoH [Xanthobacteraceae bacterium]
MLERLSTAPTGDAIGAGVNMIGRRLLYAALLIATMAGMLALVVVALSPGGFGIVELGIIALFALTLPWMAIGLWNAVIGFIIMRFQTEPTAALLPAATASCADDPITASTAILLCVRNEDPHQTIRNLEPMMRGLAAAGHAERFHVYVLSDTNDAEIAVSEETAFPALAARWRDRMAVTYRRRSINTGYKAGNIRDFCDRFGPDNDFALVLDADSFMSAAAILRMVCIMQADARLGILQSLIMGLPSTSAFARLFQFAMRLGMRSYTIGSAWWQGDCGPYWGHNALIRLAPFIAHCRLPLLSGNGTAEGHILSHDQVEAALMRRAGYAVRVLPMEDGSWEANPPTLLEFIRRDLRWCEGNMQYWRLLTLRGLPAVSRCNLAVAILMFVQSPAWIGLFVLGTFSAAFAHPLRPFIYPGVGMSALGLVLLMWFAPVTASAIDVMIRPEARRAFGGTARFLANLLIAYVFSILLGPIMSLEHTIFMIGRLFRGDTRNWLGQVREDHRVPLLLALRSLWPHILLGCGAVGLLTVTHPAAIPYALFLAAGLVLAVPLAVATSLPEVGILFVRCGVGRLPEETAPPPELHALAPAAIQLKAPLSWRRLV